MNDDDDDEAECMVPNFSELWLCAVPEKRGICFMSFLDIPLSRGLGGGVPRKLSPRFTVMSLPNGRSLSEDTGSFDVTELVFVVTRLSPYRYSSSS